MRRTALVLAVAAMVAASCGSVAGPSTTAAGPPVSPATATTSSPPPGLTSSSTTSVPAVVDGAPPVIIAGEDGVLRWQRASLTTVVAGPPARVGFEFADGSIVYQEEAGAAAAPVMFVTADGISEVLISSQGSAPLLWGIGEIERRTQIIYEAMPRPCGRRGEPPCEGRLLAHDLESGREKDLGAFSAPGYGLGPAGIWGGVVQVFNTGAEIGSVGTVYFLDLDGESLDNPVCVAAVDCAQPRNMLGTLSPDGDTIAFVVDRMRVGTEVEYEPVDRWFGIVAVANGSVLRQVELPLEGTLQWLDFDGSYAVVSSRTYDRRPILLIDPEGVPHPVPIEGTATFLAPTPGR